MNLNLCLKVLAAEHIRQADQFTIKNEPISSIDLMERASEAFIDCFTDIYDNLLPVYVFCGTGNNGGDGLVISRLLTEIGYPIEVFIIGDQKKGTQDFKINNDIIRTYLTPTPLNLIEDFPVLTKEMIIVDAIFGSGLSRGVDGIYGELIDHINNSPCERVVAVDIASGLGCNEKFEGSHSLKVQDTITFQVPKLSLMLPENKFLSGQVHVVDIGLDQEYINILPSKQFQISKEFIKSLLKDRNVFTHKGEVGRNLIIAGSRGKIGAAILASQACLKSGAGLLTVLLPKCGVDIMQTSTPEAMVLESDENLIVEIPDVANYDVIGIGPGIGTSEETARSLEKLFKSTNMPVVIDADAINILSQNKALIEHIPESSILTPHTGEFRRLVGEWKNDYERLSLQLEFAQKHKVTVLLKGAHTSIAGSTGLVFFNSTGNPGMATAGSGDVLTGIITSFLGQGYSSIEAAILSAYVHGLSGDLYVENFAEESLMASDIIANLGSAFKWIHSI